MLALPAELPRVPVIEKDLLDPLFKENRVLASFRIDDESMLL